MSIAPNLCYDETKNQETYTHVPVSFHVNHLSNSCVLFIKKHACYTEKKKTLPKKEWTTDNTLQMR